MREMQIKTSVRHYFILFMMAVLKKKTENNKCWGFPGGPVVKNLPCNARDTALGLITGLGRSHVLWGN